MTLTDVVLVFVIGYIIGSFIMALFCARERKKEEGSVVDAQKEKAEK